MRLTRELPRWRWLAVIAIFAMVAAACGSGDDGEADDTTATEATSATTAATEATTAATTAATEATEATQPPAAGFTYKLVGGLAFVGSMRAALVRVPLPRACYMGECTRDPMFPSRG